MCSLLFVDAFIVCRCMMLCIVCVFFFKQKTAYEMRISDWSSDVRSSDLVRIVAGARDDMSICLVEKAGETVNLSVGFQRSAQGACHHQPGIVPGLALEHPAPRISVSDAGLGEHKIGRASCRERVCSTCRSRWSPDH